MTRYIEPVFIILYSSVLTKIQGLVNSFGTTVMAAFAVAVKIDTLAYMPAQELGNAIPTISAKNQPIGMDTHIPITPMVSNPDKRYASATLVPSETDTQMC